MTQMSKLLGRNCYYNNHDEYIKESNGKVDNVQEKMGNISRKMETLRKNKKEMM